MSRSMRSSACVNGSPRRSTGPIFVVKITVFALRRGTKPPSQTACLLEEEGGIGREARCGAVDLEGTSAAWLERTRLSD